MTYLPILNAAEPNVIPAKTYDRIWIKEISIQAPDPNGEVKAEVKLVKYGMFDGVAEMDQSSEKWLFLDNVLEKSTSDTDLQNAMLSLLSYVAKIGIENNVIMPPNNPTE